MSEWFKEHAWKVCIRQKCIRGSNPRLSALPAESAGVGGSLESILKIDYSAYACGFGG